MCFASGLVAIEWCLSAVLDESALDQSNDSVWNLAVMLAWGVKS